MKKVLCILAALLVCLACIGCKDQSGASTGDVPSSTTQTSDPVNTLPPLEQGQYESILTEGYFSGSVIEQFAPNIIIVEIDYRYQLEGWDEKVYVIMDQAEEFCETEGISVYFYRIERPNDGYEYARVYADVVESHGLPAAKPIIYFYPEMPTTVSVQITINGGLTCTYPDYGIAGWEKVTAYPGGTLVSSDGKEYYALYWEGILNTEWDFSKGWCVRGEDTAAFLEWALAAQGLTAREANEFIVYWLPVLQENMYNVISFQTTAYTDAAHLHITPAPESLLRIFMAYYATEEPVDIAPQIFEDFVREGFTVVEWGGGEAPKP